MAPPVNPTLHTTPINTTLYPGDKFFQSFTKTWHNTPYPSISPLLPTLNATNSTVFITGGGTGIGKATAIAYALASAKTIAIFGRRVDKLASAAKEIAAANPNGTTTVLYESVDLSQSSAVSTAFTSAIQKASSNKINIFIHNAAILQTHGTVAGYDPSTFHQGLDINIVGAFNALQSIIPHLAPDAQIFNVSAAIAHVSPKSVPRAWAYGATKIANAKMFENLAAENEGWRVVNVHPGVVNTEMLVNSEFGGVGDDDVNLAAHFLVWLASPDAGFLRGKFVWVNWDVDELKARAEEIENSLVLTVGVHGVPL